MRKVKSVVVAVAVAAVTLVSAQASNVFANSYGIDYSGGVNLGTENVQIDENLIDSLSSLVKYDTLKGNDVRVSGSTWEEGYINDGECLKVSYFKIRQNSDYGDNISYSVARNQYKINVDFSKIEMDNINLENNKFISFAVSNGKGGFYAGSEIYSDDTCGDTKKVSDIVPFPSDGTTARLFVETNVKVYENDKKIVSDGLYFGITDIDAGQSYKILNNDNLLVKNNMYAKDASKLQPTTGDLRNKYNASGNYIYSEPGFNISKDSDIFVSVKKDVLSDGLRVVFGFTRPAGSAVEYYAKQFAVKYVSDKNGIITGIADENIVSGRNPSGSTSKPKDDFEFAYWKANVDVTLEDGTTIKAGNKLTPEQVKQVVVEKDITFTAVHEEIKEEAKKEEKKSSSTKVPDTGESTSNGSLTPVVLSIFGIALAALAVWLLPKFVHKKVKFD